MIPEEEAQAVGKLLMTHSYRFAKTMVYLPHYYTLKKTWEVKEDFEKCVAFLFKYGVDEVFAGKAFKNLLVGEFKYWLETNAQMGIEEAILINRKPHELPMEGNKDIIWVKFS
jgi:hypothetical protein